MERGGTFEVTHMAVAEQEYQPGSVGARDQALPTTWGCHSSRDTVQT